MTPDDHDEETLPCGVALLAATLALMTAHAAPEPTARVDAACQRRLMARKIVSNLFFLQHHPDLPPGLRQVAANAHGHWQALVAADPRVLPAAAGGVWH